jgi:hypothetical protein
MAVCVVPMAAAISACVRRDFARICVNAAATLATSAR